MKNLIRLAGLTLGLILLASPFVVLGQARTGSNGGPNASEKGGVTGLPGQLDYQADLFAGRFSYQIPFPLAPGRHDSAPSLGLVYNSANANGWCGVGWDLDLGYIQRQTRYGVPVQWANGAPVAAYDDAKGFIFSLNGQVSTLVNVGGTSYRAEIQGNFWQFSLQTSANQWVVTDKSGNQYTFGGTSGSRMTNPKSGWSGYGGTFRWSLSHVQTVLGDTADYTYSNIGNTLYPLNISYNGYSGLSETHTVDFTVESRSDVSLSFLSGYRVEQGRRINSLVHKVSGQVVWSNRLVYAQSLSTGRSLLQSVTRYGTNLTASLPPTSLGYSVQQFGFQPLVNWTNVPIPAANSAYGDPILVNAADLVDMDGDGLPDRVYALAQAPYTNLWVALNNGSGFNNPVPYGNLSIQSYPGDSCLLAFTSSNNPDWDGLNVGYTRLLDINGDGYPDRVTDPIESLSSCTTNQYLRILVQRNNSTNFASGTDVVWTNVVANVTQSGDPSSTYHRAIEDGSGVMMLDMNGDGLPDRVMTRGFGTGMSSGNNGTYTNYWVQFNTGSGFTGTNYFMFPFYDSTSQPGLYGSTLNSPYVRMIDLNGDGLPDRVMYWINPATQQPDTACDGVNTNYVVEFNNGYGFEPPVFWGSIVASYLMPAIGTCGSQTYCPEAYTGMSLQDTEEYALHDINGDGLPDRIYRYRQCSMTNWMVQINQGTNFAAPVPYGPYYSQGQYNDFEYTAIQGTGARLIDINGDGIPDHVMPPYPLSTATTYFGVELGRGPLPDLLIVVSNGIGGSVNVAYQPSTKLDNREATNTVNARKLLPFPVYTVSSLSVSDGLYPSNTTTYSYAGGKWNVARREFDGFAITTEVDPLGLTNVHWFHQAGGRDNSAFGEFQDSTSTLGKRGVAFRVDTYGSDGNPYKLVLNKVNEWLLTGNQHFAVVTQSLTLNYPGSASAYRATAQQFNYDLGNGNLTNTTDWGEVNSVSVSGQTFADVAGDSAYQFTIFAALSNTSIVDKPQRSILTTDSAGANVLRETLFSYDGATGNLLQQRERMCPTCYVTNSYGYNSYNNQIARTNEAGIATTTVFESTYQTHPASQTEGGTFTRTFAYDARSGKLLVSTDPKGLVTSNAFDAFFRPVETDVSATSNGTANVWLDRYDYQYGLASGFSTNFVHHRKADGVDTSNGHETWTYADGLGRNIQSRVEAETGSYRVSDTVYDKRGSLQFVTLPYFSSGTAFTKPSGTELGALHIYDPVGRQTNVTAAVNGSFTSGLLTSTSATSGDSGSPIGPASVAYNNGTDPWTLVATDEATKVHQYSLDAYGRTNKIVEVTSGGPFTTYLQYNLAGDLTNLIDNANNQIQYAYNNLGQLVAMADPDMGVWQYERDFAGRMRKQIDADNQSVVFNYDDPLGRLRTRQVYDYLGNFAFGFTNVFDTSDDANFTVYPGQLYKSIDNQGWQKQGYDVRGRTLKTARYLTKNGNTYTNQYTFDDADRLTQTIYPNGGPTITNIFDTGGNLSQVKQLGGSGTTFYTAQGFNAIGQLTGITFGNSLSTTYSYYANSHRLQTLATSGSKQNLTYTYDAVSDILSIADSINSGSASASLSSVTYDDLHRLTSLTRPTGTTSFSYDSLGNFTVNGENGSGSYNYGVRMPHAVKSANGQTNAYDANGNMLVRGNQRLAYDSENRLVYVETPTGGAYFGYDAAGARLWKSSTNGLQVWIDGNYEEKGGKTLYHVSANGQTVYTYSSDNSVTTYYHPDHLHSTAIETDNSGNLFQHYEYSAFGQDRYASSSTAFPVSKRYTSQVKDDETGLYFYGARYYDPLLGRFVQADPVLASLANPQHLNRYAYCVNNPLKHTDPNGKSEENVVATVSAPSGVWFNPYGWFTYQPPTYSANLSAATGVTKSAAPPTAISGLTAAPSYAGSEILIAGGASHLVGTPIGEQLAQMNAEAILTAPGVELTVGKLGQTFSLLRPAEALVEDAAPIRYSRKYFGKTPTLADRQALGAGPGEVVNHEPPLVKRWWEGDPTTGEKPAMRMTDAERKASAADRSRMNLQAKSESNKQGGQMSDYSKKKNEEYGLK